jgi:hypothetical protein
MTIGHWNEDGDAVRPYLYCDEDEFGIDEISSINENQEIAHQAQMIDIDNGLSGQQLPALNQV